jgi:hypothetical protein
MTKVRSCDVFSQLNTNNVKGYSQENETEQGYDDDVTTTTTADAAATIIIFIFTVSGSKLF